MTNAFVINGRNIKPGEQTQVLLQIARLPTHTPIDLPVFIYRAEKPGPVLLLTAGLHGDEINGVETLRRLIVQKRIQPIAGTVICIPVVNIHGFIQYSRQFPDGKDLNRSFPGSKNGSLAGRFAFVLMNEILPLIDFGVDFHTGGASKANYPHLRCNLAILRNRELSTAFAPPFVVNSKPPDHSFRKAATIHEKYILTFEGGESLRFDELAIREGMEGILRVMNHYGMSNEKIKPNKTIILRRSWWNRARYSGLFRSNVTPGNYVKRSQVLGSISDPFGDVEYTVKAKSNGYIIGLNNMCVINKGEALIHVGAEEE